MSSNKEQDAVSTVGSYEVGHWKTAQAQPVPEGQVGQSKGTTQGCEEASRPVREEFATPVTVVDNGKSIKMPDSVRSWAHNQGRSDGWSPRLKLAFNMFAKCDACSYASTIVGSHDRSDRLRSDARGIRSHHQVQAPEGRRVSEPGQHPTEKRAYAIIERVPLAGPTVLKHAATLPAEARRTSCSKQPITFLGFWPDRHATPCCRWTFRLSLKGPGF